jgi:phosphoadenosine phosphosulfate reductase
LSSKIVNELAAAVGDMSAPDVIARAIDYFGFERIALASSFSIEDQAIVHMAWSHNPKARVFTLDTGRNFQETYDVMQQTKDQYSLIIEECFPDAADVAAMVAEKGPNLFYSSVENRVLCCDIRKVRPLRKKLASVDAWITGQRRSQSVTRSSLETVEWDAQFEIVKINPLADWTEDQVWEYVKKKNVPFNRLYNAGFRSIGCAPCTRAVEKDEDVRSGRWWWESSEHKECGLHRRPYPRTPA